MIRWLLICPYPCLLLRMCQGWQPISDLGPTHGEWSVICEWQGECVPLW